MYTTWVAWRAMVAWSLRRMSRFSIPVFHNEWEGRVFGFVATVRAGLSRRAKIGM